MHACTNSLLISQQCVHDQHGGPLRIPHQYVPHRDHALWQALRSTIKVTYRACAHEQKRGHAQDIEKERSHAHGVAHADQKIATWLACTRIITSLEDASAACAGKGLYPGARCAIVQLTFKKFVATNPNMTPKERTSLRASAQVTTTSRIRASLPCEQLQLPSEQ